MFSMEANSKTKVVSALLRDTEKGKLDFSHPLQRQEGQWTRYMESLEVDSILRDWPINVIYIWKRTIKNMLLKESRESPICLDLSKTNLHYPKSWNR